MLCASCEAELLCTEAEVLCAGCEADMLCTEAEVLHAEMLRAGLQAEVLRAGSADLSNL